MTANPDGRRVPVVWLYGPPGVGKSTLGWELFDRLSRRIPLAYLDLDQVGMCYGEPTPQHWAPEPPGDFGRHRLQATILDALLPLYATAGAAGVVVSGVVSSGRGVDAELVPRAALTRCRLRADPDELRRRVSGRAHPGDDIDHILREAVALDRLDDPALDLSGASVPDALELVEARIDGWLDAAPADEHPAVEHDGPHAAAPVPPTAGRILWLSGVTAVGKSTVGWQLYQLVSRLGVRCAFVDLQQLGFVRPPPAGDPDNHRVKAANLAALWRVDRAAGARGLLVVGSVDTPEALDLYAAALPGVDLTVCRLRAGRSVLWERIQARGQGQGPPIAGDDLADRPVEELRQVAHTAVAASERGGIADLHLDTEDLSPLGAAHEILRRTDWMGLADRA